MSFSADDLLVETLASYDRGATLFAERSQDRSFATGLFEHLMELSPGNRLLDLGCGPAHDSALLVRQGFRVTAFDASNGLLRSATATHAEVRGHLVQGDGRRLPFAASTFDAIWSCASLLHLPKAEVSLGVAEALRVLTAGGVMFTSMQEGGGEAPVAVSADDPLPGRSYYFYRAEEWLGLVEGAGFELIDQRLKRTQENVTPGATGWIETFARKPG